MPKSKGLVRSKGRGSVARRKERRAAMGIAGPQGGREAARGANPIPEQKGFTAVSVRGIPLFPIRYKCLLRYYESVSLTASGAVGGYVFSANGLFDPNITGTGHQPMGFDQMMLSYEHYCVTKARVVVMAQNAITTGSANVAVQIAPSNTLQTLSQQIIENGTVVLEKLNAGPQYGSVQQIRQAVVIGKYQGIVNVIDNPDNLGTVAANPVEQEYFHIYGWTDDGTTGTVYLNVCIEYEAVFIEPKKLTQSLRDAMHQLNMADAKTKPVKGATGWDSDNEIQLVELPPCETQETKQGEKMLTTPSGMLFRIARPGKPDIVFRSIEDARKYLHSSEHCRPQ